MPEETTRRELRIPLPRAEPRECFLAISFDGLDEIEGAIANVVSASRMLLKRTKFDPESDDFNYNVIHGIRRSDVVIAVINNKKEDHNNKKEDHLYPINANVAYEIGIAHALEKPLIIVARDMKEDQRLFADIKKFLWLSTHREGRFEHQLFVKDLELRLKSKLKPEKPWSSEIWRDAQIIDPTGIGARTSLATAHGHRQIPNIDNLKKAFDYGKRIQKVFQDLVRLYLTPLSEASLTVINRREMDNMYDYENSYKLYQEYYLRPVEPLLNSLQGLLSEIVSAITLHDALRHHCNDVYNRTRAIYGCHTDMEKAYKDAIFRNNGTNASHNTFLSGRIDHYRQCCTEIISASGTYLTCLVETLFEMYKELVGD